MKTNVAPVEKKTAVQTISTAIVAVLVWLLTRYVPGFVLDPGLAAIVTGVVSVGVGAVLAWFTAHTPRVEEVIEEALNVLSNNGYEMGTMGSSGAAAVTAHEGETAVIEPVNEPGDIPAPSAEVPSSDIDTNA